jgi:hypothetical protein
VEIQFFANSVGRGGQRLRQLYPLSKVLHGFGVRRAAECEIASLEPVIHGGIDKACLREVVRDDLRLTRHDVGKPLLERMRNLAVQLLPAAPKQAFIGRIPY